MVPKQIDLLAIGSEATLDHIAVIPNLPGRGEIVFSQDLFLELEQPYFGGCSINVAVTAAKLGLKVNVACTAGNDFEASGFCSYLQELSIGTRGMIKLKKQKSAHCISLYDMDGDGIFLMDALSKSRSYNFKRPLDEFPEIGRIIIFGGPTDSPLTACCLRIAKRAMLRGIPVALAIIGDPGKLAPEFLKLADIVFCNLFEAQKICDRFWLNDIKDLPTLGPKLFFLTFGKNGSTVITLEDQIPVPAVKLSQVIDPTGAGDAYAGAVLAALMKGFHPNVAARIGAVVSSFVIEKKGSQTNLPSWDAMLQRYELVFDVPLTPQS